MTNLCIQFATLKKYPYYVQIKQKQHISEDMITQIKGLMIDKICDTFRNSFDSLIISSFIGLTATAIYGNYYYIYSAVYGIMLTICNAMSASVGNSIVEKDEYKNYENLLVFSALFAVIMGISTALLACLYQPFMKIWVGKKLLLPTVDMMLFCVYFYVINMTNIRNQYISGTGIWWHLKASYIIEAVANLLLNVILGKYFGITGILIATIVTIFIFNYLLRNVVLFKYYFKNSSYRDYLFEQTYFAICAIVAVRLSIKACDYVRGDSVLELFFRAIITICISCVVLTIGVMLSKRSHAVWEFVNKLISRGK